MKLNKKEVEKLNKMLDSVLKVNYMHFPLISINGDDTIEAHSIAYELKEIIRNENIKK